MEDNKKQNDLMEPSTDTIPYGDLVDLVNDFRDQLQSLDYRVTNKNFGSKLYQTKETINSKARFVAGADEDVAILDAQNPTWRLWVGAKAPLDAPFRVDKNGNMTASSVTLSGYLQVGDALADVGVGNITSTYLGPNSVTTAKINANAVTATKISVSSLSAISANIGTITAGTITGITITGGTIQTSSSGLRTVLGGGDDSIKFMNGSTVYGSITPFVFAGGNGMIGETLSGDAYWYIQEGTTDEAGMKIGNGDGISIRNNDIDISGDVTINDDLDVTGTLTVGSFSPGALSMGGSIDMNGYDITDCDDITCDDITCDDIFCDDIDAGIVDLNGGGYIDNARAIYLETGRTNRASISGEIRYHDGGSKFFEVYVNGFRGSIDLTAS